MHLSEGVLHTPVLLAGVALAVVGVAVGLRRLDNERLPLTALFAAAFLLPAPSMCRLASVAYT